MVDPSRLLRDLQRLLPRLEADILAYAEGDSGRMARLQAQYDEAREARRTDEHFVDWCGAQVTQGAVAWLLTCVFVRFLEDNALLEEPWLAGPTGERLQHARGQLTVYFQQHPTRAEREYLLHVFDMLRELPVMEQLLDPEHNPLWQLPVSADGAKAIIDFFQAIDAESNAIVHDFRDPGWDTRFLGDLYQDLSEAVRKRYALLQTPEFVEAFILDYTLRPAIDAFGLDKVRLIDPTCGSGHFLLGAFERLFEAWQRREPAVNARALAQRALDGVHGVDINPYAVAIARFRLLIAAMRAVGSTSLREAPDFRFHLAVGDSLLHGKRHEWLSGGVSQDWVDDGLAHVFEVEDKVLLKRLLGEQRYHVVVGNPPYITVKDKALNQAYREKYSTCHRQYSLGVPFTERFFDLCLPAEGTQPAGFVGMITANSFMKREFGKKLIEEYLPRKALTHVIDTSGAYIPGHGTPTVILFGRNQRPTSEQIRAVLGIRGEPSTPDDAAQGKVWRSIVELLEKPGNENAFVSVVNQDRNLYEEHPWSIGGGGVTDLKIILEACCSIMLENKIDDIGRTTHSGEDSVFYLPLRKIYEMSADKCSAPLVVGEDVRDWSVSSNIFSLMPYDLRTGKALNFLPEVIDHYFWIFRNALRRRRDFGNLIEDRGLKWYEHSMFFPDRFLNPLSITFAFVATHNHFVLDRGGKVFKQSAPVIKLPEGATEEEHLALLGLLNSSTAMFWMRQVFFGKGQGGVGQESRAEWEEFREFTGTGLRAFPVAQDSNEQILSLGRELDQLAREFVDLVPDKILANTPENPKTALATAKSKSTHITHQMIAWQEELDWLNYRLYGLLDDDLCYPGTPPEIALGERPFEIALARAMEACEVETTWFSRHGSTPITAIPTHWPPDYRALVEKRLQAIQDNRWIGLIERPEYKRRWNQEPWAKRQTRALREWLLDHLESRCHAPELRTCAQLAEAVRHHAAFQQVATLYTGTDTFDVQALVSALVDGDEVPQMAAARYKPQAMAKFRAWQDTWNKQRAEDAIDARSQLDPSHADYLTPAQATTLKKNQIGDIPVPPKYTSTDFRQASYWSLRGKLDVPKERFFSLPHSQKAGDTTTVIGWAGLNHLQRAQAIAAWYLERKEQDGYQAPQLLPMLVALEELLPWLKQWHNHLDPDFGERLGDYYQGFLLEELRDLHLSRDELHQWTPPVTTRGRRRKTS